MAVKLAQLLAEINETVRNSTTGALDNVKRTRAFNRVLQDLQDFADWEFTKRQVEFDFIDSVNEYSLVNFIGTTMQDNDGSTSIPDFKNPFDLRKKSDSHLPFSFRDVKEVRQNIQRKRRINEYGVDGDTFVLNFPRQTSAQIHNCDSLTANGTWAATGDATNLTIDTIIFEEGNGALNFDVSAGTSLVVSNSSMNPQNLETLENKSHWTVKVDLPTITNFTSVTLRWGNDLDTNYWELAQTVPAGAITLATGVNTFAFNWADATPTGSPDATKVDSVRVTILYSASTTDTDFRIDDIRVGGSVKMLLDYYSLAMVQDASDNFQLEFDPDNVTQTDTLLGDSVARRTLIEGTKHELYEILGGRTERDRTDSERKYNAKKIDLLKRVGNRIRRPSRVLNFPGGHGRRNETNADF